MARCADTDNHKGYIPANPERELAKAKSYRVVHFLYLATFSNKGLTYKEYRAALDALEDIDGVHWA